MFKSSPTTEKNDMFLLFKDSVYFSFEFFGCQLKIYVEQEQKPYLIIITNILT